MLGRIIRIGHLVITRQIHHQIPDHRWTIENPVSKRSTDGSKSHTHHSKMVGNRMAKFYEIHFIHISCIDSIIFGLPDRRRNDLTASDIKENYIAANNLPMGVLHHKNRIFITLPRRRRGMPATLTYVSANGARGSSPSLQAYPNFRTNELHVRISDEYAFTANSFSHFCSLSSLKIKPIAIELFQYIDHVSMLAIVFGSLTPVH